jgi:hypothetical protein
VPASAKQASIGGDDSLKESDSLEESEDDFEGEFGRGCGCGWGNGSDRLDHLRFMYVWQ